MSPARLLHLQHTIGNAAVQRFLADRDDAPTARQPTTSLVDSILPAKPASAAIQRTLSTGGISVIQRDPVEVVTKGRAILVKGFWSKNVTLDPGSRITVDFAKQKKDKVPVYADGVKIGMIKGEDLAQKITLSGTLPKGIKEIGDVIVDVNKLDDEGHVKTEKGLAAKYRAKPGTILFHGTYPQNVDSILSTGLDPNYGGKGGGSDYDHWAANCKGYVYLTPSSARAAAGLVLNFWLGQGDRVNNKGMKEPTRSKGNKPAITVLMVKVPKEGLELEGDPDLRGVSLRTKTYILPTWFEDTEVFDAGPNRDTYDIAYKEWEADYEGN